MKTLGEWEKLLNDIYRDTGQFLSEYLISTEEFNQLENEIHKYARFYVSGFGPKISNDSIFINFYFGPVTFRKYTSLDNPYNRPVRLNIPKYLTIDSVNCEHQYVNVGFTSEKYVCKVCNEEQV